MEEQKKSKLEGAKEWFKEHEEIIYDVAFATCIVGLTYVSARLGYNCGFLNGKLTNVEDTLVKEVQDRTFNRTLDAIYDSGENGIRCSVQRTPDIKESVCFLAKKVEN